MEGGGGERVDNYAGEVAKAVLEETMAERIWSIPCSVDCHNTHSSHPGSSQGVAAQRAGGSSGALCWTPESSSCSGNHLPTLEFQAHCSQYLEDGKAGHLCSTQPGAGTRSNQMMGDHDVTKTGFSSCSSFSRTETDVVHYRLSGYSRDSLHLPKRWPPATADKNADAETAAEETTEELRDTVHARNKSVENLSSTPDLHTNGNKHSLRKGLSVSDITRFSPERIQTVAANGAVHKHPSSRLQFLRHFGLHRTVGTAGAQPDEVTNRTGPTDCTRVAALSSVNSDIADRLRKGGQSSSSSGGKSLRKTFTNMFHLKPPSVGSHSSNNHCSDEIGGEGRRKTTTGGGFIARLTAKRNNKTVPPGKRALPPVPPSPVSPATSGGSRTPSPQQMQQLGDRVPSPMSLEATDWSENGACGGAWSDQSPDLACQPLSGGVSTPTGVGASSPSTVQSQMMDFAASIEKVKDHGWYWGPLSGEAAERILAKEPDGSFVVRDSSDDHYIFSLTFKLNGFVRHVRIEHDQGNFSFGSFTKFKSNTIVDFIENAVEHSRSGRYLFFLHRRPVLGPMRVQLLHPVSRFKRVQSLQHLCRYVIVKHVRKDHLEELPVPNRIKTYLNTPFYYSEQIEAEAENDRSMLSLDPVESAQAEWTAHHSQAEAFADEAEAVSPTRVADDRVGGGHREVESTDGQILPPLIRVPNEDGTDVT